MSTLTRTNSHSRKPQYKDYVTFLESYRNGKKDDQNSVSTLDSGINFSLSNSSNNSSSSVFSDVSDASKNGFKEHLDNLKYATISPNPFKSKSDEPKPTVKTEMFIEIKNQPTAQNYSTKAFEVQSIENQKEGITLSVSSATKIFEKNGQTETEHAFQGLKPKQSFSKKMSIGEISKKFETSSYSQPFEQTKTPPKKANNTGGRSKKFETGKTDNGTLRSRPKNFNSVPKPFASTNLSKVTTESKNNFPSPKPAIISPKPVFSPPQFPKFSSETTKPNLDNVDSSLSISPSPPLSVSPPPVLVSSPPIAISAPTQPVAVSLPPPPPPPPLPPANFSSKPLSNRIPKPQHQDRGNSSTLQKIVVQANGVPQNRETNGFNQNGTIDKNDPRIKKAVYGALRNMYGAYHDQANDYLATLPKNRVKKNNGLDSIINSIASQGGLDKLNGRVNPNPEVE